MLNNEKQLYTAYTDGKDTYYHFRPSKGNRSMRILRTHNGSRGMLRLMHASIRWMSREEFLEGLDMVILEFKDLLPDVPNRDKNYIVFRELLKNKPWSRTGVNISEETKEV